MPSALHRSLRRELRFLRGSGWDLALLTWIPLVMLGIIAWLFSAGVARDLPIAVVDADHGAVARHYVRLLDATPGVHVSDHPTNLAEAFSLVRRGAVWAVVVVPAGTSETIDRGGQAALIAFPNAAYNTQSGAVMREIAAATQRLGMVIASGTAARLKGAAATMAPPLRVESRTLFNPQTSYELLLVPLIETAMLHLLACIAAAASIGRELRDGTAAEWLAQAGGSIVVAIVGKLAPPVFAYTVLGAVALGAFARNGWPVAGSLVVLLMAQFLLYLAYAAIGLLFVGLTGSMVTALSLVGVYAGASLAFSGALFPTAGAPLFTQIFSAMTPYRWFAAAQAQQLESAAPLVVTLPLLGILAVFAAGAFGLGAPLVRGLARDPACWGRR